MQSDAEAHLNANHRDHFIVLDFGALKALDAEVRFRELYSCVCVNY